MNSFRGIAWCLALVLFMARIAMAAELEPNQALPNAVEKKNGLTEMREWLNQRNLNRNQQDKRLKNGFSMKLSSTPAHKPRIAHAKSTTPAELPGGDLSPRPSQGLLEPQSGRGPDGRIRNRLIINEDGPDQLQINTGAGYVVVPYSNHWLKPKELNPPKFGAR